MDSERAFRAFAMSAQVFIIVVGASFFYETDSLGLIGKAVGAFMIILAGFSLFYQLLYVFDYGEVKR